MKKIMNFLLTFKSVLLLFIYAIPGYLLIKTKLVKPHNIGAFAVVLLYVNQPCLSLYSFQKTEFTLELFKEMGIFFFISLILEVLMLFIVYFLFRKKLDIKKRICTVAAAFGNVGFLGVPLLEALLPDYPKAICFSAVFIVSMNLLAWTLGLFLMTGDKKFFSWKKLVLNPPILTLVVALPLFFTNTKLPDMLFNAVELLGKMTTFLCMLILGMRFATVDKRKIFKDPFIYLNAALKLIAFPSIAFLLIFALPIDKNVIVTMFILCCCPTASVILNLAEIHDSGQETASNLVMTSTLFSIITIPLMLMLI